MQVAILPFALQYFPPRPGPRNLFEAIRLLQHRLSGQESPSPNPTAAATTKLAEWLSSKTATPTYRNFTENLLTETCVPSGAIQEKLAFLIITSRISPELYRHALEKMQWTRTIARLIVPTQPSGNPLKRGNFGEALAGEILADFYQYDIPVHKLRYALEGDISLTSTDMIAIKIGNGRLDEVCFVECKYRTTAATGAAAEAYGQLMRDAEAEIPTMVRFVADRMRETNHAASDLFEDYMFSREDMKNVEKFCIFLVWDKDRWTDTTLENLESSITNLTQRIHVERVVIQELRKLTRSVFLSIGVKEIDEDE